MIATGLCSKVLSPRIWGARSIAFFRNSGIEYLYSGVELIMLPAVLDHLSSPLGWVIRNQDTGHRFLLFFLTFSNRATFRTPQNTHEAYNRDAPYSDLSTGGKAGMRRYLLAASSRPAAL